MNRMDFPENVSIAIPAYKAEKELETFLPQLLNYVPNNQITVLLDGIFDNSKAVCEEYRVSCIHHEKNRGKGAALQTLFDHISPNAEWIITMDADGQHIPQELAHFTEEIHRVDDNCVMLIGSRPRTKSTMPLLRRFSNGTTSAFLSFACRQKIEDSQCGYRAYRTATIPEYPCLSERFEMESEIIIRASAKGYTVRNIPVSTLYNGEVSHISHVRDTVNWIKTVLKTMSTVKQETSA